MKEDAELLAAYAGGCSEADFTELVRRRIGFVYTQALWRVANDRPLAEEVTQRVFIDLARKAAAVAKKPSLTGWLYVSTAMAAAAAVRTEQRRKVRETVAYQQETLLAGEQASEPDWRRFRPLLDELMLHLAEVERDAVIQRFFEQKTFAEIGRSLRLTEDAARKRVERAVERLRGKLSARGIRSTSAAVGLALGEQIAHAVPAALPARVAGVALGEASAAGGGTAAVLAALKLWLLPGLATFALVALFSGARAQHGGNRELQREIEKLANLTVNPAALERENRRLADAIEQVATLRATLAQLPAPRPIPPPVTPASAALAPVNMVITGQGAILWEGRQLTAAQFLAQLRAYRTLNSDPSAGLSIQTQPGSFFEQTFYITDEARKAGILVLQTETPSRPNPAMAWFRKPPTAAVREPARQP